MKNYAVESGFKYFLYFDEVMKIVRIEETGARYCNYMQFKIDSKNNQLFYTLKEAVKSLNGYSKPILFNGENINTWQPDIFISFCNGVYNQEYFFSNSNLLKYEA